MAERGGEQPSWSPSALFEVATAAVEGSVAGTVHVRGRVVETSSSRGGTQFVTLVDEDVAAPRWDSARLGLVVFGWKARHMERWLGGVVSEVLTVGTIVDAVGELGLGPGRGGLQLRTSSIAVAADSADSAAVAALRERIERERWVEARPALPPVLRRVGALISVAGDGDLDEALRVLEHDAFAPAFCRHRIHPHSATARVTVPDLLDHHVRAGVDAVLIAFGGHLPEASPWDSIEILEAVHRAHLAGVPVVAGFAHGRDQPLTKLVAHNHAQASAAVSALVRHNRALLGRVEPALRAVAGQVDGAAARVGGAAVGSLRSVAQTSTVVAERSRRSVLAEVGRVEAVARSLAERDLLGPLLPDVVAALGDPAAALRARLGTTVGELAATTGRVHDDLELAFDSAGRLPGLLRRGFALVTTQDGGPLPQDAAPAAGARIRVTTAATTFGATVDATAPAADPTDPADDGARP